MSEEIRQMLMQAGSHERAGGCLPVIHRYPDGARIVGWPGTWQYRIPKARAHLATDGGKTRHYVANAPTPMRPPAREVTDAIGSDASRQGARPCR